MAQNHIVEWVGVITLFLFGVTMIVQGHFIIHGKYGYRHCEREKQNSANVRKQLEKIINAKNGSS